ncbi:T9SS type A sorting domain-containing protein [candidate division WOR-3 bacterium]|nr:T9SS type A sorting domain-containing protein [candidate division WOR-3 bacterium]
MLWLFIILATSSYNIKQVKKHPPPSGIKTISQQSLEKTIHEVSKSKDFYITRLDTFYLENFESGMRWAHKDLNVPYPPVWHPDTFQAYEGTGKSWWMGDYIYIEELGDTIRGYLNHWYQVLDTREIVLPSTSCTLTFVQNRKMEDPAGAEPPYDSWDGCNVRISTDGGATWTVLDTPYVSPAYNCRSFYSFGYEHGEGPGIPGWGGSSDGWENVTVNLSSYAGDTVKIRWAFASDPAYCTYDQQGGYNPDLIGWQIDNIDVAHVFTSNAEGDDTLEFTTASISATGSDIWHLEEATDAPSPTHCARCCITDTTYKAFLKDAIISPIIIVPDEPKVTWDFSMKGHLHHVPDQYADYFYPEISIDGGPWENPTPYVFILQDDIWYSFSMYPDIKLDITKYAGRKIQFRIIVVSYGEPLGDGMFMDDFVILTERELHPPSNLHAETGDNQAKLTWSPTFKILFYDKDKTSDTLYYVDNTLQPYAVRFTLDHPAKLSRAIINFISVSETFNETYDLVIWDDSAGAPWHKLLTIEKLMPSRASNTECDEIDLSSYGIEIDSGDFYIGIDNMGSGQWGPALDDGSAVYRSYCWDNGWAIFTTMNMMIRAEIEEIDTTIPTPLSYNLYKREKGTSFGAPFVKGLTDTFYLDTNVVNRQRYYYAVSAVYQKGESRYCYPIEVMPNPPTVYEIKYDAGNPYAGYNVGTSHYMAARFTPDKYPTKLIVLEYYVNTGEGDFIAKVWNSSEKAPLNELYSDTVSVIEGWNELEVEPENIVLSSGDFYVGLQELPSTPSIGIDATLPIDDRAWYCVNGEWGKFTELGLNYDLMIRTFVDTASGKTGGEEQKTPETYFLFQNYPNPFSFTTAIRYQLPTISKVSLKIYDVTGRLVKTLVNARKEAGQYTVNWDASGTAPGIYFAKIETDNFKATKKLIILK